MTIDNQSRSFWQAYIKKHIPEKSGVDTASKLEGESSASWPRE